MKKFYQDEWHEIYFKDFAEPSLNLPEKSFYNTYYDIFFKKYNNFNQLEPGWVSYKIEIANFIKSIINDGDNILSIGCGVGIVEDFLVKSMDSLKITALEPSINATKWIRDIPNISLVDGYFPEALNKKIDFNLAYANNIDYVFNEEEYESFLKSVIEYGIKDFLVITSANYNLKTALSLSIKSTLGSLKIIKKLSEGQFWGYLRTKKEHKKALLDAGFKDIEMLKLGKDTIIIKASI